MDAQEAKTPGKRLNYLIDWLIANGRIRQKNEFARRIGYNVSTITDLFRREKPFSGKFLKAVETAFSDIDTNWLQTGEGQMVNVLLSSQTDNQIREIIDLINKMIEISSSPQQILEQIKDETPEVKLKVLEMQTPWVSSIRVLANTISVLGLKVPVNNSPFCNVDSVIVTGASQEGLQELQEKIDETRKMQTASSPELLRMVVDQFASQLKK